MFNLGTYTNTFYSPAAVAPPGLNVSTGASGWTGVINSIINAAGQIVPAVLNSGAPSTIGLPGATPPSITPGVQPTVNVPVPGQVGAYNSGQIIGYDGTRPLVRLVNGSLVYGDTGEPYNSVFGNFGSGESTILIVGLGAVAVFAAVFAFGKRR